MGAAAPFLFVVSLFEWALLRSREGKVHDLELSPLRSDNNSGSFIYISCLSTSCGTQHSFRALNGTHVLLAAAPTASPCIPLFGFAIFPRPGEVFATGGGRRRCSLRAATNTFSREGAPSGRCMSISKCCAAFTSLFANETVRSIAIDVKNEFCL